MIYLGNNPVGVSTNAIPSDYEDVKDDISTLKIKKLNSPETNGISGQILRTNGDGTTVWDNAATEEEISESVSSWLEDNISGGETIAVDSSLTVQGAAADAKKTGDEITSLKSEINALSVEETLLRSELPGTTVSVVFDVNGNPTMITHSANGSTVRTDLFVWVNDTVTETRSTAEKRITITTNLSTLAQTVSGIEEVE